MTASIRSRTTGGEEGEPGKLRGLIVGSNPVRLWGMSSRERLRRCLRLAGIAELDEIKSSIGSHDVASAGAAGDDHLLIVSDDWVFDPALIRTLAARPGTVLIDPANGTAAAAHVASVQGAAAAASIETADSSLPENLEYLSAEQLSGAYQPVLRKREAPCLLRLTQETQRAIERRTFDASYKGVTDAVTKYLWPRPALAVTRLCAQWKLTPNQITCLGFVLTLLSFWLFWNGRYAGGLASAWLMTFLDTVDGKLARVTLTSSKLGGAFDHGIDLIHPPFWWWAWIVGLPAFGAPLAPDASGWVLKLIVGGYVVQRLIEGSFELFFGMQVHVWRRFDSRFRLWTARRNPNLLILTPALLVGRPDLGIELVTAWTTASLAVHAVQLLQAALARRRGPLHSWLSA